MANKQFGNTLRTLRKARGYTQQQAADPLGLKNKKVPLASLGGRQSLSLTDTHFKAVQAVRRQRYLQCFQ